MIIKNKYSVVLCLIFMFGFLNCCKTDEIDLIKVNNVSDFIDEKYNVTSNDVLIKDNYEMYFVNANNQNILLIFEKINNNLYYVGESQSKIDEVGTFMISNGQTREIFIFSSDYFSANSMKCSIDLFENSTISFEEKDLSKPAKNTLTSIG